MCRGWLDVHPKEHLLSLRLVVGRGMVSPDVIDLPSSGVPVFESGAAAAAHGLADIEDPGDQALHVIDKLARRKAAQDGSIPD